MSQPILIVQARMSSSRLPGKMLREVSGKPMLAYVIERLRHVRNVRDIIVATSIEASDDPIADACATLHTRCFRGALNDVAGRFLDIIEQEQAETFVRICGDSPMIDPAIVERAVEIYEQGGCDVVSNIVQRTFPKGQSVEVVRSAAFVAAMKATADEYDREHVTPFLYRHSEQFSVCGFTMGSDMSHVQLSVDTQRDFEVFQNMVAAMDKPHWSYGADALIAMLDRLAKQEGTV